MSDDRDTGDVTPGDDVGEAASQFPVADGAAHGSRPKDDDTSSPDLEKKPQAGNHPEPTPDPGNASTNEPTADPRLAGAGEAGENGPAGPGGESRRRRRTPAKAAKPRRKAPWWELPALVLLAVAIAIVVKSFIVQPFYIPSESMEHTLHGCAGCSGDRILVNKPIYSVFRDPEAGDIVVFHAPDGWDGDSTQPPATLCCGLCVDSGSWSVSCRRTARCSSSGSSPPAGRRSRGTRVVA